MIQKLFFRLSSLKEKVAKPNFSEMSLVFIGCVYLLNGIKYLGLKVKALPDLWKTASAQLFSSKITLYKSFVLEDRFVVGSLKNRLLLIKGIYCIYWRRLFVGLSFISDCSFVRFILAFTCYSPNRFIGYSVLRAVIFILVEAIMFK